MKEDVLEQAREEEERELNERAHAGEVAIVTGANKGLGREIARRLAAEGMVVHLGARDERRGRAAAEDLGGEENGICFLQLDVTDQAQVDAALARVAAESGRPDTLGQRGRDSARARHAGYRDAQ